MADELLAQWTGQQNQKADAEAETHPGIVAAGVVARVEKFDQYKGFGFVSVPELRDEAFLHARVVEAAGFEEVRDGDDILCDIVRNTKGFAVSVVHDVVTPKSKVYAGSIIRLFEDRGYGFVDVPELGQDAFFHYSLFPRPAREGLREGQELSFEVQSDAEGKLQVRKIVD
jgi:cold shock CspA family protein